MGYSPSPIRRDSVISQAAQEICRYIEAERLGPGEALPPETRLSQMLGISRNSLREALRVLHGLGHVEKTAGRRVVVTARRAGRQKRLRPECSGRGGAGRKRGALAHCAKMRRAFRGAHYQCRAGRA